MKAALFVGALLLAGAAASLGDASAHGGTYRGPGDTVPPGVGGGGTGSGPVLPGPTGPSLPGTGGAPAPGPPTPGHPGRSPAPGPGGTSTPEGNVGPDLTVWDFWWGFNKDPYLQLRARLQAGATLTGSGDWWLGHGAADAPERSLRPSPVVVRERVVPALLELLETERANDVIDSTLIALAKIGDVIDEGGVGPIAEALTRFLDHPNQQVAETAAVSLGILGSPRSVPLLMDLLRDTSDGRLLVGKTNEVPYRTRAFAAYGLGLVARRSSDHRLREEIGAALVEILESPHFATRDIKVAVMIAFGLCPVDWNSAAPVPPRDVDDPRAHVRSREAQLAYLLDVLDPARERATTRTRHWFVRAHAPTALARLLEDGDDVHRESGARALLALVGRHSRSQDEIRQSCVLALGRLGNASDEGRGDIDAEIRDELVRQVADGSAMERRFALLALAASAGRAGPGASGTAGVPRVTKELLGALARGKGLSTWAGLAIGVLAYGMAASGQDVPRDALAALADAAQDCKRPADIGALVLGLGIARQASAEPVLVDRLEFFSGSDEAQGYCAVALGMIGARRQVARIQEIVRRSEYRAPLLREAAVALGLLGDKALVPYLVERLRAATGLATQAALAQALGTIGDGRSIDPLLALIRDESLTPTARGFGAAALGMVCDRELLPWNAPISVGTNYRANTVTLTNADGTGILDLL